MRAAANGYELVIPPAGAGTGNGAAPWRKMKQSSALFTQVTRRIGILHGMESRRLARHFAPKSAHGAVVDGDGAVPDDAMEILLFLHQRMQEHYDDIVYLYIPRILYDDNAQGRIRNPERRALYHEFARRAGVALVDPSEELLLRYQQTRQPQHGFQNSQIGHGHANVHGHEVIGQQLAAELEKHLP